MRSVGTPSDGTKAVLPLIVQGWHAWAKHKEVFTLNGMTPKGPNQKYLQVSDYLYFHPCLSPIEVNVLMSLIRRTNWTRLSKGERPTVTVSQVDIAQDTRSSAPSVRSALKALGRFGLISTRPSPTDKRTTEYRLNPGPYPMLGDLPYQGTGWLDMPDGYRVAQLWRAVVLSGEVNTLQDLNAFLHREASWLMPTPANPVKTMEKNDHYFPWFSSTDAEPDLPSSTDSLPLPRARVSITNREIEGKQEATQSDHQAAPGDGLPTPRRKTHQDNNLAQDRTLADVMNARPVPKRKTNPVSSFLGNYRSLVEDTHPHLSVPPSKVHHRVNAKRMIDHFGLEDCLGAMRHVFDNWDYYRRQRKLHDHQVPPLFVFISGDSMTGFVNNVRERFAPPVNWNDATNRQMKERVDTAQAEVEALLRDDP